MRLSLFALSLLACTDLPALDAGTDVEVGLDAPVRDAPVRDAPAVDAPRDVPDAPRDSPDAAPVRDPRLPPLVGACDPLSFDLADPSTYDTPRELSVAFRTSRCASELRCGDPQGAFWCDPTLSGGLPTYAWPVDVALARTCLEAALALPCEGGPLPAECLGLEWDPMPDGAACSRDDGCASGYCEDADPYACTGHCAPPPVCPTCAPNERCWRGRCEALLEIGAGCLFLPTPCVPGAFCAGDRCVALPRAGEPCAALIGPVPGSIPICGAGLGCRDGTCLPLEGAAIGEVCDAVALCGPAADCIDGHCRARPAIGEPCDLFQLCADGGYCGEHGVCAPLVAPGCGCDETVACPREHRCIDGVCQRIGAVPTPCELGCPADWCLGGFCDLRFEGERCRTDFCNEEHVYCDLTTNTCEPLLYPGEDCSAHPDACRGRCVDGTCAPIPRDPCHP